MSACSEREVSKFAYQSAGGVQTAMGALAFGLGTVAKFAPLPQAKVGLAVAGAVAGGVGLAAGYAENQYRSKYDSLEDACQREKNEASASTPKVEAPVHSGGGGGGGYYGGSSSGYMQGTTITSYWERGYTAANGDIVAGHWEYRINPIFIELNLGGSLTGNVIKHSKDITGDGKNDTYVLPDSSNGVLVYDYNGDGVGQVNEWALTSFVPGAKSDYDALLAFNSAPGSWFDGLDKEFSKFKIGIDSNSNGSFDLGELHEINEFFDFFDVGNVSSGVIPGQAGDIFITHSGATKTGGNDYYSSWASVSLSVDISHDAVYSDSNATIVNSGSNNALIWSSSGPAVINLSNFSYGGHQNFADAYMGVGNDQVYGSLNNNIISGGGGADILFGNDGDDIIIVDAADFSGGNAQGGSGFDVIMLSELMGQQIVLANHGFEAAIGSSGADNISGAGLSSSNIFSSSGNDNIFGGDGHDLLAGGTGSDYMSGGNGDDVYLFDNPPNEDYHGIDHDVIHDTGGFDSIHFTDKSKNDLSTILSDGSDYVMHFRDGSTVRIVSTQSSGIAIEEISFNDSLTVYDTSIFYNVIA